MPCRDNTITDMLILIDSSRGTIAGCSSLAALGYCGERLVGRSLQLLFPELAELHTDSAISAQWQHVAIRCGDGTSRQAAIRAEPVRTAGGDQIALHLRCDDVMRKALIDTHNSYPSTGNDPRQVQTEWHTQREFLDTLFEQSAVGLAVCDLGGRFISVNTALCEMLGYSEAELLGKYFSEVTHRDDVDENVSRRNQAICEDIQGFQLKKRYIHKSGHIVWVWLTVSVVRGDDQRPALTIGQIIELGSGDSDTLGHRHGSDQRDTLVREVQHRIKNNLQAVTGLLRRQMRGNPAAVDVLRQAIGQVEAIAIVHGLQSTTINQRIRACEMLVGIIGEANALQESARQLQAPALLDNPALMQGSEAVPVALIFNELITNAIKHHCPLRAFDVGIVIERLDVDSVRVTISNPAQTLPLAFDFALGQGIGQGLRLVRAIQPRRGMDIDFEHINGRVHATLILRPPIIYAEFASPTLAIPTQSTSTQGTPAS